MENFIITIGRQAGSGGREIGMRLAQRLGIPYYGRQELMEIAKGTPDYEEVQSFYEEQPVDDLLYAIATSNVEEDLGHIPFRRIRQPCTPQSCSSPQTRQAREPVCTFSRLSAAIRFSIFILDLPLLVLQVQRAPDHRVGGHPVGPHLFFGCPAGDRVKPHPVLYLVILAPGASHGPQGPAAAPA